jgi:hypothetical protein
MNENSFFKFEYYLDTEPIYSYSKRFRQEWYKRNERDIIYLFSLYNSVIKKLSFQDFLWFIYRNSGIFDE